MSGDSIVLSMISGVACTLHDPGKFIKDGYSWKKPAALNARRREDGDA